MFSGAARLASIEGGLVAPAQEMGATVYEGKVMESSPQVKVLSLSKPEDLKGMRVVFLSGIDLQPSQVVRLFGRINDLIPSFKNPGTSSWKWLRKKEGITCQVRGTVLSVAAGSDPIARLRRYFKENIENSAAAHSDILKALTIGDRTSIPQEKTDLFMRTGTSHVLAISGFNVGIISGFFFFIVRAALRRVRLLRLSGRDSRYASLLAIPFPFVFMLVAGAGPSVIRATIMIAVFMLALFLERERHFYNTMALAALIILLLYPHSLLAPSFQLTFMSLLFIVMFMEKLLPLMRRIKTRGLAWSASTILSTAAATLGTAPIVIYYFHGINPFCLLHNLITIPLLGVAATALSLVGMTFPGGRYLLTAAGQVTALNVRMLQTIDFGYLFPVVRPNFTEILLYYGLVMGLLHAGRKPVAVLLLFVLAPLLVVQISIGYGQRFNEDLRIHFIDVGMGDATLIEAPKGIRILIDGGGYAGSDFDVGKHVITPFLLYRKIRHIDYVINTHPHGDHIGGLPYILKHFRVSHLVTAGLFPGDSKFLELMEAARERGIRHLLWKKGDVLATHDFRMDVLHPEAPLTRDNLNNTSLVLRLQHGERRFLLPGDILSDVEEGLLLSGVALKSDILKIAHHGSAHSNSLAFICAVKPGLAVLSAGAATKNLPSSTTLERYEKLGIPLLRTDRDGLIEIRSDGNRVEWKTYAQ
jgi:competence protein ComEC